MGRGPTVVCRQTPPWFLFDLDPDGGVRWSGLGRPAHAVHDDTGWLRPAQFARNYGWLHARSTTVQSGEGPPWDLQRWAALARLGSIRHKTAKSGEGATMASVKVGCTDRAGKRLGRGPCGALSDASITK